MADEEFIFTSEINGKIMNTNSEADDQNWNNIVTLNTHKILPSSEEKCRKNNLNSREYVEHLKSGRKR